MFGQNAVAKQEQGDGTSLKVVKGSPFLTLQGEGPFTGRPAVFVRLNGCPLRCYFCDTHFDNPDDPTLPVSAIVEEITKLWPLHTQARPLVVVTGGEPTRQNLTLLVQRLLARGYDVQIETAGLFYQEWMTWPNVTVVVSPKSASIDPRVHDVAHAFKYVIHARHVSDEDGLPLLNTQVEGGRPTKLCRPRPGAPVYVTPMDTYIEHSIKGPGGKDLGPLRNYAQNDLNKRAVATVAMQYGYIAGVQLHKELGDLP